MNSKEKIHFQTVQVISKELFHFQNVQRKIRSGKKNHFRIVQVNFYRQPAQPTSPPYHIRKEKSTEKFVAD
ncbi:hypothetical protein CIY45_003106 [Salmonella enterica subsp. enterica serovar Enteritidis]|nr:hypothetical protein [Salmonella enterica subsp. enterica serovar Enteritidis]